jgi:hypothetical protein
LKKGNLWGFNGISRGYYKSPLPPFRKGGL